MDEYFTLETLLALPGAILAVNIITSTVAYLGGAKVQPFLKWVAIVASLGLGILTAYLAGGDFTRWIVAVVNSLVVFLAAVGANTTAAALAKPAQYATMDPDSFVITPASEQRNALVRWL